jgi:hypothetical protein
MLAAIHRRIKMPLLSYSTSPAKGTSVTAELDKASVVALTGPAQDSYWSDPLVTQTCIVVLKSTAGNQKRTLTFDFTLAEPQAALAFPARCRDAFEVQKVTLIDYLGDKIVVLGSVVDLSADDISLV